MEPAVVFLVVLLALCVEWAVLRARWDEAYLRGCRDQRELDREVRGG